MKERVTLTDNGRIWVRGGEGEEYFSAIYDGKEWSWGMPEMADILYNFYDCLDEGLARGIIEVARSHVFIPGKHLTRKELLRLTPTQRLRYFAQVREKKLNNHS